MRLFTAFDLMHLLNIHALPNQEFEFAATSIGILLNHELIEADSSSKCAFRCTDKGNKFAEMICSTPLPMQSEQWVDPRTEMASR